MSPVDRAARVPPDAGRCAIWPPALRALRAASLVCLAGTATPARAQLPPSTLAVRVGAQSQVWWQSRTAPAQWLGVHPLLRDAIGWRRFAPGADWATVALEGVGEASRLSLIVVRLEPAQVRAHLALPRPRGATWVIDSAPATALVAFNGGQFERDAPWGWVVSRGVVRWSPGRGPLSTALVWDSLGRWQWIAGRDVAMAARRHPPPFAAFQSYPTLLSANGTVPAILRRNNPLVSVTHRDARLAIGEDRDGRLVIAMTRFTALGDALGRIPFGVTTPEMAAIMGALGCHTAVALDGGTSAQLQIRGPDGRTERWPGLRAVPMGVVFESVLPP